MKALFDRRASFLFTLAATTLTSVATAREVVQSPAANAGSRLDCGYRPPEFWQQEIRQAVARGEIDDPAHRALPEIGPRRMQAAAGLPPCLSGEHLFAFQDTQQLLLSNFSTGALLNLMAQAANALLAAHGDNFDFLGYWVNFTPHHTIGSAFYHSIENDVTGLGLGLFNNRPAEGIIGDTLQGSIMMWDINSSFWQPGDLPSSGFTRLVLGQEFEHRFAMFLPPLADGRVLQGNNAGCGRASHWNWQVDGQGSSMEISEWVGSNPAELAGSSISFNTDNGGVFSYTDLYLMGYVSPLLMDLGNSELRFMTTSDCASPYNGPIGSFSSADIIDTAGPRVPDSTVSQKDFRTGWIMIHLPGDPPSTQERDKAAGILAQHMVDWRTSTLGQGTMTNTLFADCDCNGVPDGVPDLCGCPWDLDGVGEVGITDLLALLAAWGTDPGGPPDFDGDGDVGITDLLALLAAWGPCRGQ